MAAALVADTVVMIVGSALLLQVHPRFKSVQVLQAADNLILF
jgi:hypothetical protein